MEVTRCAGVGSLRQRQKPGLQEASTHDSQALNCFKGRTEEEVMELVQGVSVIDRSIYLLYYYIQVIFFSTHIEHLKSRSGGG